MRLAFLSDIHGNVHALSAVQRFLKAEGVGAAVVVGDLVGYGASPGAVIDLVRRAGWPAALGSSDARAAFDVVGRGARAGVAEETLRWTRSVLSGEQLDFLRRLPVGGRVTTERGRARYCHGAPHDPDARLNLLGDDAELTSALKNLGAQVLVCGGTHVPYVRQVEGGLLIDPGSVGLSLNGEPGADVAILDVRPTGIEVQLHKVAYDVHAAAFDILAWQLPPVIADVIKTGCMG